jgi:hypothetical protein
VVDEHKVEGSRGARSSVDTFESLDVAAVRPSGIRKANFETKIWHGPGSRVESPNTAVSSATGQLNATAVQPRREDVAVGQRCFDDVA